MKPQREHATNNAQTYMVTSSTWERRSLFHVESWAKLLVNTLYHYRNTAYLLHEFVVMPDHLHALITPLTSVEKSVQFIKGGFSYRAKRELGSNMEIWQKGFQDHRIRAANDYAVHVSYIRNNPVKKGLCQSADEFPYSSAYPGFELDAAPLGLKPQFVWNSDGAAEAAPFQNETASGEAASGTAASGAARLEGEPFRNKIVKQVETGVQGLPLQSKIANQVEISVQEVPARSKIQSGSETSDRHNFERARLQARRKGAF